jgi:phage terminase large subunit GpA-like protein
MPISIVLIDSGFRPNKEGEASANAVYQFCRRFARLARPTKGYATLTAPIIRTRTKVAIPGRQLTTTIELVRLDTDFWKSRVHDRFAWPEGQPGGITLSCDATDDYCRQIVSEVRRVDAAGKPVWITLNRRNHALDCEAMNEAAGHMLGVARIPVGTLREMPPEEDEIEEGEAPGVEGEVPAPPARPMTIGEVAWRLNNPKGTHL